MAVNRYDRWSHEGAPSGDEAARIQRGIDDAMRGAIQDRLRSAPQALVPADKVGVAGAVEVKSVEEGRGFIEAKPLESPSAPGSTVDRVIESMVNAAFPHGSASPLRRRKLGEGKGEG